MRKNPENHLSDGTQITQIFERWYLVERTKCILMFLYRRFIIYPYQKTLLDVIIRSIEARSLTLFNIYCIGILSSSLKAGSRAV